MKGLGSFPFARRYLGNHCYFLFLRLLRCFSSPRWLQQPMYSAEDSRALSREGSPIQKSPDQSLFSNSPKLIAAYHVFHRLLTPRHPPSALCSLATTYFTLAWFNKLIWVNRCKAKRSYYIKIYFLLPDCQRTWEFDLSKPNSDKT